MFTVFFSGKKNEISVIFLEGFGRVSKSFIRSKLLIMLTPPVLSH